jgi:adenylate cyclase
VLERRTVHIEDVKADPEFTFVEGAQLGETRTALGVPLMREGSPTGVLVLARRTVERFAEADIELVETFADQAVIAIENARLLNELRQRTTDLTEALEQQTATSEVLQVISGSSGDLKPVFHAILANAVRICEANFGTLLLYDGSEFRLVAAHNPPPAFAELRRRQPEVRSSGVLARLVATKQLQHVPDCTEDASYKQGDLDFVQFVELCGARTFLGAPMLKENELIGVIGIHRQEVRAFTDKQIELISNFAAQAVIAIENARLLNELRQRTNDLTERTVDLTEALEQQTATSEVLQAISSSPGEVEQVFTAMLEKAVRICDAAFGNIFRWDGSTLQLVAGHKTPPAFAEARRQLPVETAPNGPIGRMIRTKAAVHIADLARDQLYLERSLPALTAAVELGGVRTLLVVPLLKEREPIGAFALSRQEVRPFTDKQIELVQNFAAQAVIAIENTRLLNELRERTEEVEKLNKHLEQRVTDQVDEIERMGRLRRFLPPQVADLIVASGSEKQLESHRREITALFCDLRGFTGFTESADAEDVMALLREYHTAIGEIIIKYNGTLERYAGDGVMVIFNDPVPVENPALQAVLMALEVREAIGSLTETWRRWGHELGFGIGIAHGFATLGTIGFEGRFDYAAIGTVSNVASRLCDEAKPGQILISPRVLTKVENAVKVEPVGEFELKGIRRPLAAYNVVGTVSSQM